MSTFAEKSSRVNIQHGFFYEDSQLAYRQDSDARAERRTMFYDCLSHGLIKPFNTKNGTFLEHSWLMIKYPSLHFAKIITSALTLQIGTAIVHAISLPLSLMYHALGLFTRSLATMVNACLAGDEAEVDKDVEVELKKMPKSIIGNQPHLL